MSKYKYKGFVKQNFVVLVESKKDEAATKISCTRDEALNLMAAFEIILSHQKGFEMGWNFLRTDDAVVTMIRKKDYKYISKSQEDEEEEDDEDEDDGEPFNPLYDFLFKDEKKGNSVASSEYKKYMKGLTGGKNGKETADQKG